MSLVQLLLDHGAKITTEALANACEYSMYDHSLNVVQLLLDNGAKVDSEALKDATKTRAKDGKDEELKRLLRAHEVQPQQQI